MQIDETVKVFVIEATDLLQDMENQLLHLESHPDDADTINALFRAAHTIKGSAGIVGVESVEKFTHQVENLLSNVRDGKLKIDAGMSELLLDCRDHITVLVDLASEGNTEVPEEVLKRGEVLLQRLALYLEHPQDPQTSSSSSTKTSTVTAVDTQAGPTSTSDNWHISVRFGADVFRCGMDPMSFINYLGTIGVIEHLSTITDAIPTLDAIDPETCYLGFEIAFKTEFDKKTIEDVFEFVKEDCKLTIIPPHSKVQEYIKLINDLPEDAVKLGEILVKSGAITQAELEMALTAQFDTTLKQGQPAMPIGEILVKEGVVSPEVVDAALDKQKKIVEQKTKESKTIRVDAEKLDSLITMVGELVIAGAGINQHAARIGDPHLLESASVMSRLVENIRERAMQVRMVPIGETFSRFNRVVRDISKDTGKDIELVINGGDTELDKTVTEKIGDPLMHLVRNAADHGIESPEERISVGKPARGTIWLNAYNDAGSIVIEVVDDGRGLSKEKILAKALQKGMITEGQNLSDREIFALIFQAGFSTAEQVTKLSGRGVGMDVVRKNIEALRGTVELESKEGKGTTVRIRLPLTLAIIDGFMVRVGQSLYVIPLEMVLECIEMPHTESTKERRHYVNLRGEVLPYIKMNEFLNEHESKSKYQSIVVVTFAGQKVGLVVDELVGEVQTVIKSLGKLYKDIKYLSGATILGDGSVALILDIPKLVSIVQKQELQELV